MNTLSAFLSNDPKATVGRDFVSLVAISYFLKYKDREE